MADNRMYLRCRTCGRTFYLGKSFGSYYILPSRYKVGMEEAINEFYEEHSFCCKDAVDEELEPKFEPRDVHYENRFEIAYETYHE